MELQSVQKKDLAEAIGVTPRNVYNWENGYATPSIRAALLISRFLNIPINSIFSIDDEE
jgi:Predicted transcriptional regulators